MKRKLYSLSMLQIYLGKENKADELRKTMDEYCAKYGLTLSSLARRSIRYYMKNCTPKVESAEVR